MLIIFLCMTGSITAALQLKSCVFSGIAFRKYLMNIVFTSLNYMIGATNNCDDLFYSFGFLSKGVQI